jgi:hypothetical protein
MLSSMLIARSIGRRALFKATRAHGAPDHKILRRPAGNFVTVEAAK